MSEPSLSEKMAAAQSRVTDLHQRSQVSLANPTRLLPDALEELHTAIEELRVADEEMRTQNEELLLTRQRVEAERQRYHNLFEFAPEASLITTPEGKILDANLAASRLLNIAPRFLKNRPLAGSVYEEDLRAFHTRMSALTQTQSNGTGQAEEWVVRLRRRHAGPFYAALTVAPVTSEENKPAALRWLVRDITERRQAEAAQRQLSVMLDAVTDILVALDSGGRLTYLNAAAARRCRAAGQEPETLIGQALRTALPGLLGAAFPAASAQVIAGQQTAEYEDFSPLLDCRLQVRLFPSEDGLVVYAHALTSSGS